MSKKILLIIGILVIVGLAIFLVYGAKPQTDGGSEGFSLREFLPFGQTPDPETTLTDSETKTEENINTDENQISNNEPIPRLRKISSEPVSGAVIFNSGASSIVRFVEKGTGNVYEARSDSNSVLRLTNTTIPKIIRAFWLPNGSGFLAQTLLNGSEIIETSFVKLNKNAATTTENLTLFGTTISKLPTGIKEIATKPDSTKIFYYVLNGMYSDWFISNPDGTNSNLVYSHPLTEWLPNWPTNNTVELRTKGSSGAMTYTYTFDTSNKTLKKTGEYWGGLSSQTKNLPEKCVATKEKTLTFYCAVPNYLPAGNYPDDWYKGLTATQDFLAKIDVQNDISFVVTDFSSLTDEEIDAKNLSLSPDQNYLIFQNKIDGELWLLRIKE